jgi:hypothetical protein
MQKKTALTRFSETAVTDMYIENIIRIWENPNYLHKKWVQGSLFIVYMFIIYKSIFPQIFIFFELTETYVHNRKHHDHVP